MRTDIAYPLPERRASAYLTTDPVQPSRTMKNWTLVEIYPLQPLTQHILASHRAYGAAEDARASTGQGALTSSDTSFEHKIGANQRLRDNHPCSIKMQQPDDPSTTAADQVQQPHHVPLTLSNHYSDRSPTCTVVGRRQVRHHWARM